MVTSVTRDTRLPCATSLGVTLRKRRPQYRRGGTRATTPLALSTSSLGAVAVLAAAVATPVVAVGISSVADESEAPATAQPSGTGSAEVSLAGAPIAHDVPQDIASGGDEGSVREVSSPTPFSMIGVTWKGDHDSASARIRAQQPDGSWGEWFEADSAADALDAGQAPSSGAGGGTDPVYLGTETTKVQIALNGVELGETSVGDEASGLTPAPTTSTPGAPADGTNADVAAPATDAADVQAVLLSPDLTTPTPAPDAMADVAAEDTGTYNDVALPKQPTIISRKGWGADESMRCQDPYYDDSVTAGVVHHTAGSNDYTKDQSAGIVRGIYTYHAQNLGWCDVGYNVLVDKYGQAFEGRAGGLDKNVEGAHAGGFNGNTWGISMMGDYSSITPPDATIEKVGEILGWRLAVAGVDPKGKADHYSEGTSYTMYAQGTKVNLPNIFAHRDVGLTTCPGDAGYAQMGRIRDIAKKYSTSTGGTSGGTTNSGSTPTKNPGTGTSNGGGTTGTTRPSTSGDSGDSGAGSLEKTLGPGLEGLQGIDRKKIGQVIGQVLMSGRSVNLQGLEALGLVDTLKSLVTSGADSAEGADAQKITSLFTALKGAAGPLGKSLSGAQKYGDVSYNAYENGAIYSSPSTGAQPVWGRIGDAWAAQGFEHGALGLPVAEETSRADGSVAQEFEHGTLVYDLGSGQVSVEAK